jgi:ferredoxin-NADP reductase
MSYLVKILDTNLITHNVKQFIVEKPLGYTFIPGQATDVAVNTPEWKDQIRPFTFTGLNEWNHLEFMIKIYPEHKGVTEQLGHLSKGSEFIIHDVFGAIQYKGKGIFIAGGAGITPFVSIFRDLYLTNQLPGNKLFFSNKTSQDVILEDELTKMLGSDFVKILTRENKTGYMYRRIDRDFLKENITNFRQNFYICGPDAFVQDITSYLLELGASVQQVVIEQ